MLNYSISSVFMIPLFLSLSLSLSLWYLCSSAPESRDLILNVLPRNYSTILFLSSISVSLGSPSPRGDGGIGCSAPAIMDYVILSDPWPQLCSLKRHYKREHAAVWDKRWEQFYCASQEVDCGMDPNPPYRRTCIRTSHSQQPSPPHLTANRALPWESHWQWARDQH